MRFFNMHDNFILDFKIIARLLLIILLKSSGEQVGGWHIRIIMRAGLWSLSISNSQRV